jgi:hypothetical protein
MEVHWMRDKRTREWTCCGQIWQLMMSSLFPERVTWAPTCDRCGETGSPYPKAPRRYYHGIADAVLRSQGVE